MRRCWLLSIAVLCSTAAVADPLETQSETGPPGGGAGDPPAIVNGTVTNNYSSVVALIGYDPSTGLGGPFCSGTLISPRWVLTAAHCVTAMETDLVGHDMYVAFMTDVYEDEWDAIKAKRWIAHPDYRNGVSQHDIGLIELGAKRLSTPPIVLNDEPVLDSMMGQELRFVGYGGRWDDDVEGVGVRRTARIPMIRCIDPGTLEALPCTSSSASFVYSQDSSANLCQGDSGGAALEELPGGRLELVGVNSIVIPQCVGGANGVVRVDRYVAWIKGYAADASTEADTDTDSDTDADSDIDTEVDTGWAHPERPDEGAYERPVFGFCGSVPAAPSALWAAGLAAIALGRRRRA